MTDEIGGSKTKTSGFAKGIISTYRSFLNVRYDFHSFPFVLNCFNMHTYRQQIFRPIHYCLDTTIVNRQLSEVEEAISVKYLFSGYIFNF